MAFENKNNIVENLQNDAEIFALLGSFYLTNPSGVYTRGMSSLNVSTIKDEMMKKSFKKICDYAAKCGEDESEQNMLELKRDWTKLFRGISPNYGPRPPYAQLFAKNSLETDFLSELAELYLDVGYTGYQKIDDRLDYIGIILNSLAVISLLRKKCIEEENEVEYKRLTEIFKIISHQYFASWFKKFQKIAETHVQTFFYEGVLELTALIAEDFD